LKVLITRQKGIVIIENMIALLIFAMGILGIVGLLAMSTKNVAAAKYRNDASLLANQIIGQMWVDDKTNASLKTNYENGGAKYLTWVAAVSSALPGVAVDVNPPIISINANNVATITVRWQAPGESTVHKFEVIARING
jgi:type IV pilus assembly protein PilV